MRFEEAGRLVWGPPLSPDESDELLSRAGFADRALAHRRLIELCPGDEQRRALAECLPHLLLALSDSAAPDASLINFERYAQATRDRAAAFRNLAARPRAVEILVRLFVGSQFLTEILLRNPGYLDQLTNHKRVAEFKSRPQFREEALEQAGAGRDLAERLDALRRFQRWELLRIGACDSFGLMDLKSVTVQLSLLADALVQSALVLLGRETGIAADGFCVLGFGKLGGEELNYSSDIDLVFLAEKDATRFWGLGQKLIRALTESTEEGFLYRVDMRLRPWGRSGALVNSVAAHLEYLAQHGRAWEKQALLKARPIAGDLRVGEEFLRSVPALVFGQDPETVRKSVREMKQKIEENLQRQGRAWGEVKSGEGSIRDIEFTVQSLQLVHGGARPEVRSIGTLDGLVRLAEFGFLQADEYRRLADGYVFLRTVEHALQLAHHKQTHSLPEDRRELAYLARKLDYPDADTFLLYYERHCTAVRAIWEKYLGEREAVRAPVPSADPGSIPAPLAHMEPSYAETFGEAEIERHSALLDRLTDENVVELDAVPLDDGRWRLTLVGYDHLGDLSAMCGLLSVHGCNIVDGHAFSDSQIAIRQSSRRIGTEAERRNRAARKFVNVFTVVPPPGADAPAVWLRYRHELAGLLRLDRAGSQREAQAQLARRVAETFRLAPEAATPLYPVDVRIDNETSPGHTVLHIRSEDTIGFLYELANALALSGIDVARVTIVTDGRRVVDTLYVTDSTGRKIVDPRRQQELRTAVVLIKHFTHLLPRSPNPEAALLHFGDFLEKLLREPDRLADLASLERSEVLEALARLLGVSNFLWEDFLRLQHANLFPVVQDVEALAEAKSKVRLAAELRDALAPSRDAADRRERLNAFKDREMFRTDMRHILGHVTEFGRFSAELSDLAEVVVEAAFAFCGDELRRRYGSPRRTDGAPCAAAVLALGKCGGRELGYASDIELMIVYEDQGTTDGPDPVTTTEFFLRLVESFSQAIRSRSEGIFQIDLRLRPYGRAGSLAVAFDAFRTYYAPDGPAWPYERQSLVKLRPIAGDAAFGARIAALRDELVYTGEPFDVAALRGMREKQIRQLVEAGTIHAKLGPGGLVDCEYLVQGLQIAHGRAHPELRTTNTVEAMDVLCRLGILSSADHARLRAAYVFLRELIDALRMVRGHARDLTVPPAAGDEFAFLARRLGYDRPDRDLQDDLLRHMEQVRDLGRLLEG